MKKVLDCLSALGIAVEGESLPSSSRRFPDGAQYRIEIPSVEGPQALAAVLEEAARCEVPVHRVSQGSGIMLLTDGEIRDMCRMARGAGIELSLFVGPRAAFDTTPQPHTAAGKVIGASLRGGKQLAYAVEDVRRGCGLGLRSVLVADLGLLWTLSELKKAGELPAGLVLKVSIQVPVPNPATARVIERLGAGTINVSPDLSVAQLSELRQAVGVPLDFYVEVPDNFGGYLRYYEAPEIVRVAAPVYLKMGLRNAPDLYPSGKHLEAQAVAMARERLHRARLLLDTIRRYLPEASSSKPGAAGLGVPE